MAHGFICTRCGWEETIHIHGWSGMEAVLVQKAKELLPGYVFSQERCAMSYQPSDEEIAFVNGLEERKQGGQHEGQH